MICYAWFATCVNVLIKKVKKSSVCLSFVAILYVWLFFMQGVDPADFIPYEEKFCNGSGQLGCIILGDSASAHFHIPPEWIRPSQLNAVNHFFTMQSW